MVDYVFSSCSLNLANLRRPGQVFINTSCRERTAYANTQIRSWTGRWSSTPHEDRGCPMRIHRCANTFPKPRNRSQKLRRLHHRKRPSFCGRLRGPRVTVFMGGNNGKVVPPRKNCDVCITANVPVFTDDCVVRGPQFIWGGTMEK